MCLVSGSLPKILKFLRMTFLHVDVGFVCTSTSTLLLRKTFQHTRGESYADSKARPDTREAPCPALFEQCVGSLTSHRIVNNEELRDGAYGFIVLGRDG